MRYKYSRYLLFTLLVILSSSTYAQSYDVKITPLSIPDLGGLQSFVVGTHNGDWLIIGGRLDGLHRREPFASFSQDGRNNELLVVNPHARKVWRSPLINLPTTIKEQLASTNMQYYQDGNMLLCTGGYAYSPTEDDHITFPFLTIIDIPKTINAIKNNSVDSTTFFQIKDEIFRVTGGAMNKIGDVYYLVGGHNFMGRYNPVGPDHGPGFIQEYTNQVRRFSISKSDNYVLKKRENWHDERHLHRRDYNLTPYLSQGKRGLTLNSGVFKNTSDLPWLYPVTLTDDGYMANEKFRQFFNHYHCAYLPIYDKEEDVMQTIFFGGIAQFYLENDIIVQDNDVPFVNTISSINRKQNGTFEEIVLSDTMPGYLGAGSIFIFDQNLQYADQDILDGSQLTDEFFDVGYIFGGIESSQNHIFWINTGSESVASETIFKVSVRKAKSPKSNNFSSVNKGLLFYPNPEAKLVRMSIELVKPTDVEILIEDEQGNEIHKELIGKSSLKNGMNYHVINNVDIQYGAYYYTVSYNDEKLKRKVVWSE